jgi:hypothetical protein
MRLHPFSEPEYISQVQVNQICYCTKNALFLILVFKRILKTKSLLLCFTYHTPSIFATYSKIKLPCHNKTFLQAPITTNWTNF